LSEHPDAVGQSSQLRLTFLILEGYVYLAFILGVFLAAPAFLLWGVLTQRPFIAITAILVGVPVTTTAARALRALWFAVPAPAGVAVGPNLGARLHQEIHDIARRVGAPRVHRIVVSQMSNASVLQIARIGVFWPTNTVVIGYPLLATLSVDVMRTVIAHELAHVTHHHGRLASWVHRTRLSWVRLLEVLERHQSVPIHVHKLFRFYVPRLHIRAAAVSRQQEFLADRLAADVFGRDVVAESLLAIAIVQDLVDQTFWPGIHTRIENEPNPPNPFSELGLELWDGVKDRAQLIDRLLHDDTEPSSTHPALRERLAALKQAARWPAPVTVAAVDYYFGTEKFQVTAALDKQWQEAHGDEWRERHGAIRTTSERLAQLSALPSPTPAETFERGQLLEGEGEDDEALALYRVALQQGLPAAGLAIGRVLLDRQDESGIPVIDAAMDADAALVEHGCAIVRDFLEHRGRHVDAYRYQRRMTSAATMSAMARAERQRLSPADRLRPYADHPFDVAALSRQLGLESGIRRAFLVVKELRYSRGTQIVLAVLADGRITELGERLQRERLLPETVLIVAVGRHDLSIETALAAVPGALVFDGTKPRAAFSSA
jgi:Zn-dependent protease with chaperone function